MHSPPHRDPVLPASFSAKFYRHQKNFFFADTASPFRSGFFILRIPAFFANVTSDTKDQET